MNERTDGSVVTADEVRWLREYCLSAASYADQNTCVGQAEHDAAAAAFDRAEKLFDRLVTLLESQLQAPVKFIQCLRCHALLPFVMKCPECGFLSLHVDVADESDEE